jgi:peptidoglycan/xylan/chitin deacetylase (PgdA/CDA1 family)
MRFRRTFDALVRRMRPPEPKPLILMYHRIANESIDPWGLTVGPAHFEEQLWVLRRTRRPVPLTEFVRDLAAGTLHASAVAVTFDDGYADNLFAAKPRLAAAGVPATIFLATGFLDRQGEFWWDELARLFLIEDGPRSFELVVRGRAMHFDLGADPPGRDSEGWRAWSIPLTRRQAAYVAVWDSLRHLEEEAREALMIELRSKLSKRDRSSGSGRAMTRAEVGALVTDGLVTIGAHTVSHPLLTGLPTAMRRSEIVGSKAACEALLGAPVAAFAYPYGDLDAEVRAAVAGAGFACGCATTNGPATAASDIFALPRIQVLDRDGEAFERALRSASAGAPA